MRNHTQRIRANVLIPLIALTALGQVTDAGQSKRPAVAVPPDVSVSARGVGHPLRPGASNAEAVALNRLQTKRPISSRATTPGSSLSFMPAVTYGSGGGEASSVAVADVNGDGKPDLLVANFCGKDCTQGGVDVLLGNGDGTFKAAVSYASGGSIPYSIAVADVNGDGKPDLVVANCGPIGINVCGTGNSLLGILKGNGDGTFQAVVTHDAGAKGTGSIGSVVVTDINGDGKEDLIVAICVGGCSPGGAVGVLLGNGNGTFQTSKIYNIADYAEWVAVADVNGDGKPDVLVSGNDTVSVLLGNGDGSFQPAVAYHDPGGFGSNAVAAADVNGDGKPDLLVANACNNVSCTSGSVGVLLGNGDGSFQAAVSYDTGGTGARSIEIADVNGDGKPDLLVANFSYNTVGVLLGTGDGTFQQAMVYGSGGDVATSLAVSDVNGDGRPDVLVTDLCVTQNNCQGEALVGVLLNNTTGGKSATSTSLISSLNPSIYGQKVTWTATVTSFGSITPTGKVSFTWDGHNIGSATLNSSGVATLTKSNLNADPYPLTAEYVGDAANLGSTSAVLNQMVLETTSTATLTSSPNPSTQGQAVTFTAKITSPTVIPKGPVTFTAGKTVLETAQLSGGVAKLTISSLAVGSTKVTATYYGDSNIAKSSASVVQTVR